MALKHPRAHTRPVHHHPVSPLFGMEPGTIPRHSLPEGEMPPEVALQIIRDELMLDGNARLNLATFVTTWAEPQA
jgi:glutamate decarboxylase